MTHLVGRLVVFKKEDEMVDAVLPLEMTDYKDGEVEIAFNDRGERVYVRFHFMDLMRRVLELKS